MNNVNPALSGMLVPLDMLRPDPQNAREHGDKSYEGILDSYREHGQQKPVVGVYNADGSITVIDGNGQLEAVKRLGWDGLAVVVYNGTMGKARKYALAINRTAELSKWNFEQLGATLLELKAEFGDDGLTGTGFTPIEFADITAMGTLPETDKGLAGGGGAHGETEEKRRLKDRFLVPPFSILDTRTLLWRQRRDAWKALGIESEEGRAEGLAFNVGAFKSDTSIFDPVLCELVYRWFTPVCDPATPPRVLDPTCGGSVRGIVAAALGLAYTGNDLRSEQVSANRAQWAKVSKVLGASALDAGAAVMTTPEEYVTDPEAQTPVQVGAHGGWIKRDDLFRVAGVPGGKARTCLALIRRAKAEGFNGVTTAGSRSSPQVNIVARICAELGIPCVVHVPAGALTPELEAARDAGATVVQHSPGHNSVIVARARDDAKARGWFCVPFGMECEEATKQTRAQVPSVVATEGVKRIVVPVGSGMSFAGILHGLRNSGYTGKVLGVVVGADPTKRLDKYAPRDWRSGAELVTCPLDYGTPAPTTRLGHVTLDPHYEAKCVPYLQEGDLLWIVGVRATALEATASVTSTVTPPVWVQGDAAAMPQSLLQSQYDLMFTCPPYGDLEQYSDLDSDLSNMPQPEFVKAWRKVIADCVAALKPNRFAVVVIGDYRDSKGFYCNFQGETVAAFEAAGARFYNEAVIVNSAGTLALRIGPQWPSRKMGRQHQTLLVFFKGDPKQIAAEYQALPIPAVAE